MSGTKEQRTTRRKFLIVLWKWSYQLAILRSKMLHCTKLSPRRRMWLTLVTSINTGRIKSATESRIPLVIPIQHRISPSSTREFRGSSIIVWRPNSWEKPLYIAMRIICLLMMMKDLTVKLKKRKCHACNEEQVTRIHNPQEFDNSSISDRQQQQQQQSHE